MLSRRSGSGETVFKAIVSPRRQESNGRHNTKEANFTRENRFDSWHARAEVPCLHKSHQIVVRLCPARSRGVHRRNALSRRRAARCLARLPKWRNMARAVHKGHPTAFVLEAFCLVSVVAGYAVVGRGHSPVPVAPLWGRLLSTCARVRVEHLGERRARGRHRRISQLKYLTFTRHVSTDRGEFGVHIQRGNK